MGSEPAPGLLHVSLPLLLPHCSLDFYIWREGWLGNGGWGLSSIRVSAGAGFSC
jgi:hypothetical protein